ncbi:hypothetical protein F5I97DRAFT_1926027 [Phlebopus sp. FC_14]|nr:hypothetical protein F5I97DRAFT_1926027 [Phlebopus sp. FC_14]
MKFEIEWKSSHYHSDGRRRTKPKASTVHGWLVKWRATFSGNEHLRKEGIREMREAKAVREWKKQRKAARKAKKSSKAASGLWPLVFIKRKQQPRRPSVRPRGSQSSSKHSTGTRRVASPRQSTRPTHSRHSSSNRQGGQKSHNSRQASYSSGREVARASKPKR